MTALARPLVSVLTPAHDAAATIEACVRSVQAQDYARWEQIVVDDGSGDATWERLTALAAAEPRLRIARQPRGRQAAARNRALGLARGELLALLDADDLASPGRLTAQVEFLEANPDVDVVGGAIVNLDDNGARLSEESLPSQHEALAARIFTCCPFFASTVMARRRVFDSLGGFDPSMPPAEDYDLWLRGYRVFRYHNLGRPLALYRRRRMRWINARASSRAIARAARSERRLPGAAWQVVRPLVAYAAYRCGYRGGTR